MIKIYVFQRVYGYPFPTNASWEHCKGTTLGLRGYTCGLWTTFHAITINAFIQGVQSPTGLLFSIRSWVENFFGCLDCRRHFSHMTTTLYPLNARRVFLFFLFIFIRVAYFYEFSAMKNLKDQKLFKKHSKERKFWYRTLLNGFSRNEV